MSTPTFVNSVHAGLTGSVSSTTVTINGTTQGNTLIVYASQLATPSAVFTVSDNKNPGNYNLDVSNNPSGHAGCALAHYSQIAGGNTVITVSSTVTAAFRIGVEEWSNVANLDQTSAGFSASNNTSPSSGATGALATTGELVVSFAICTSNTTNFTAGGGFTPDPNLTQSSTKTGLEYLVAGSTSAQTGAFTLNSSQSWDCIVATYTPVVASVDTLLGQGWV